MLLPKMPQPFARQRELIYHGVIQKREPGPTKRPEIFTKDPVFLNGESVIHKIRFTMKRDQRIDILLANSEDNLTNGVMSLIFVQQMFSIHSGDQNCMATGDKDERIAYKTEHWITHTGGFAPDALLQSNILWRKSCCYITE